MLCSDIFKWTSVLHRGHGSNTGHLKSIATEHIICAGKLVLAANFYYSLVTVTSINFQKHGILLYAFVC